MNITLNIDAVSFNQKPAGIQIAGIRKRLATGTATIEADQIIELVETGCSFTPAAMTGTTGDTWQSQQVIIADIDNDRELTDANGDKVKDESGHVIKVPIDNPLSSQRARAICEKKGIVPFMMYHTFSDSEALEKYRIVIVLDKPITDAAEAAELTGRLAALFNEAEPGCADTTMADTARLVFGGRPGSACEISREVTPLHVMRALPPIQQEASQPPEQTKAATTKPAGAKQQRTLTELREMRRRDIESFDLQDYILRTEPAAKIKRSGKTTYINPCPICGHNDDFAIDGYLWHCFGASSDGQPGGTIIDYLMHKDGLTRGEALEKFNQIKGYDVIEWKRAARQEKDPQRDFSEAMDKYVDRPIKAAENDDQSAATDDLQALPGLLTPAAAIKILETADTEYLELPRFEQFSQMAKLKKHDTIAIAADTGAGKSSLALNFLYDLQDRYPALYINLEMDEPTILQRLVSIHTGIELDRIEGYGKDQQTRSAVNAALTEILSRQEIQLLTDVYDLKEIELQIEAATRGRTEPTIVFIDTALLIKTGSNSASRYERFTQISEELRRISRLNNIILFALLQQSREGKKDETKRPTNSSLKESGSWENDATKVMFLWYNPKTKQKELVMTKNRNGRCGNIELNYSPHTQTYSESRDGLRNFIRDDDAPAFDDDEQMILKTI